MPESPTSWTRTKSTSGFQRMSPRTMSLLKFSSAASRSIGLYSLLSTACNQPVAYTGRVEAGFVLLSDSRSQSLPVLEVDVDFVAVAKVVADHRVYIGQVK